MDELEKIIAGNRDQFDTAEPNFGHFERFQNKLAANNKTTSVSGFSFFMKVAAVAILVILSGLYIGEHAYEKIVSITHKPTEINQAQQHYMMLVNQQLTTIEQMDHLLSADQKAMLIDEFSKMDALYQKLQSDLKAMPNDPRIVQAMITHYQMKIEILNRIINDLNNKQTEQAKNNKYEI
jgi:hypothetical protein